MEVTKETIEQHWPLTDVVISEMPSQGMAGKVGIVSAKEGKYTYKITGPWKTPENLDRDLGAYKFLNQKFFPYISTLLETRDSKRYIQIGNELIYLISFIEGTHPEKTPQTYSELGKIVAMLHSIENFPFETDYRPAAVFPELIADAEKYTFGKEYVDILKSVRPFENLTMVLTHSEITPGNTIQTPEGKIMVIDWDEVGIGPAVLDLGVSLINHFVTEDLQVLGDNARAYYENYFARRPMNDAEKEYIWDAALFWACCWIKYGDINKRWERIKWAIQNKKLIETLYA